MCVCSYCSLFELRRWAAKVSHGRDLRGQTLASEARGPRGPAQRPVAGGAMVMVFWVAVQELNSRYHNP